MQQMLHCIKFYRPPGKSTGADIMVKTFSESLFKTGNVPFETLQKISEINTRTLTKLAELQFDLATLGFETTAEQAKLLSDAGNYEDLYSVESSLATAYGNKFIEISRETTDLFLDSSDELAGVIEEIFDTAKDEIVIKTKAAAPVTAKKTTVKVASKPATKPKKVVKKSAR